MNERIFELAKQADLIQWDSLPSGARTPDHESVVKAQKFAELIIQECAQVSEDDITDGDACCTNTADRIARQIKKHFGVEE